MVDWVVAGGVTAGLIAYGGVQEPRTLIAPGVLALTGLWGHRKVSACRNYWNNSSPEQINRYYQARNEAFERQEREQQAAAQRQQELAQATLQVLANNPQLLQPAPPNTGGGGGNSPPAPTWQSGNSTSSSSVETTRTVVEIPWGRACREGSDSCAPGGCFDLGEGKGARCTKSCTGDADCGGGMRCSFEVSQDANGSVVQRGFKLCR